MISGLGSGHISRRDGLASATIGAQVLGGSDMAEGRSLVLRLGVGVVGGLGAVVGRASSLVMVIVIRFGGVQGEEGGEALGGFCWS